MSESPHSPQNVTLTATTDIIEHVDKPVFDVYGPKRDSTIVCPLCGTDLPQYLPTLSDHWKRKYGHAYPKVEFEALSYFCTFDRCCVELKDSHAAYNHLADHCRLRKGVTPVWLRETGAQNAQEQEESEESREMEDTEESREMEEPEEPMESTFIQQSEESMESTICQESEKLNESTISQESLHPHKIIKFPHISDFFTRTLKER